MKARNLRREHPILGWAPIQGWATLGDREEGEVWYAGQAVCEEGPGVTQPQERSAWAPEARRGQEGVPPRALGGLALPTPRYSNGLAFATHLYPTVGHRHDPM